MTPCFATLKRRMLTVTLALFLVQQWLGSAEAVAAGIVPAANAPAAQHPLTDTARNGVPIVDIAPPSAAGVSNNQYSQFNTASQGAILNNSTGNVSTQLGGWISGNPLLGSTPAKVILNQVTSGTPSQLLGALEVAGQAADVVVANPAGIACNGCSFINTPHATLTTGIPEFDAAGNLRGFNVTQGVIDVGAGGLDAQQAERLDLDARGLTAEGGIWAHQLGVVAGAADVPYGSTQASAQAGAGNAPEFAVDVSALGGMYADTIDLVATDAGLGVNSQGRLAALQGNLRLAADGKLSLADTSATGAVQLSGANVSVSGITASTGGSVQVNATGTLDNSGQVDAASGLTLQAASVTNTGTLVQRDAAQALSLGTSGSLANTGTIASAGGLSTQAGSIADTSGAWSSQGDLSLQAGSQTLTGTTVQAGGNTTLAATAGDLRTTGAQITGNGKLSASASGLFANAGGTWQAGGNVALQGSTLSNSGTVQTDGTLTATATNVLDNTGGRLLASGQIQASGRSVLNDGGAIQSNQAVTVTGPGGLSNRGGVVSAAQAVTVQTGLAALDNADGRIVSTGALALSAGATDNTQGLIASTASNLQLSTQGQILTNTGGAIQAGGSATVASGDLGNAGGTLSADSLNVSAGNLDNTAGLLAATQGLSLNAQALINAQSGTTAGIQAGGALSVTAASLSNDTGFLGSDASVDLSVGGLLANGSGTLQAGAGLNATAAQITGGGSLVATGPLSLRAQSLALSGATLQSGSATTLHATAGDLQTTRTAIASVGDLSATATGAVVNSGGTWQSAGNAALQGSSITNSGTVQAGGTLQATAANALNNAGGTLESAGNLSASGASLTNDGGTLASGAATTLAARQGLSNQGGTISAASSLSVDAGAAALNNASGTLVSGGAATVSAGALSNAAGTVATAHDLAITSAALDNTGGRVQTTGNLVLGTQGQNLTNAGGKIEAAGSASLSTGALDNTGGTLAANALTLTLGALTNDGGSLVAATTLQATTGALGNAAGLIESGGNLSLDTQGATLSNTASGTTGGILSGGTLSLRSGALGNTTGVIASQGDQSLSVAGDLDNAGGSIASQGTLAVTTPGTLTNTGGTLAALGTANLDAGTLDNSAGGQISAQDLTLTAGSIGNRAGTLQAAQDASVSTSSLDNTSGMLSAQRQLAATATSLANSGGTLVGNAGLSLTTSSSSFGGTINSAGAVNLTVNGAYVNTGTLSTQGDLNVQAQSLSNAAGATLAAGGNLSATTSGDLDNAGTLDAAGSATLAAGGTLSNSGLIDSGAATTLTAQALDNTGRIYGGTVGITAASLSNSGGAVIASRADMTIAADSVFNTGDSTLLALGALSIAGAFDPGSGAATRATASLLNASSTIQAGGNLTLDAASVTNRNDHLVLGSSTSTQALPDTVLKVQGTSPATALLDASTLGYVPYGNPVDGGRAYWVLPSTRYPISVFGAAPLTQEIVPNCSGVSADGLGSCTYTYTYAVTDPIWQKFGVTPPPPAPVPPAGAPTYTGSDAQGNVTIVICADPSTGQDILTGACGTYWQQENVYQSAAVQAQVQQAQTGLDQAITAFNADQSSRIISQYVEYHVDSQTTVTPSVVSTDPARILAGGNLTVSGGGAGSLLNADSAIVAGGSLDIATGELNNQSTTATQTVTQSGSVDVWASDGGGTFSSAHLRCNGWNYPPCGPGAAYSTASSSTVDLNTVTVVSGSNPGTGSAPAASTVTPSSVVAASVAAPRPVALQAPGVPGALAAQAVGAVGAHAPPALQQVSVPSVNGGAPLVVSTSPPSLNLPANQLFQVDAAPNAPYVVETDPAFTNQENFLSSDYYLQQLAIDPAQWQLRYGDGFAEQQLVQNQILALTGRDILSNYASTQAEYQALMNAGVAYAKAYGIAPGVSLSAAQMARITTDMVLLTTQTVTLPDGSTRQVLVPQVYLAHPQGQDLTQGGALIAGGTVTLTTAQDLVNSGTISGSNVSASAGQDLVNRGTIAGQKVLLSASNDLQDLSGLVQGTSDTSSLSLLAGRDLLLQTQAIPVAGVASTNTGTTSLGHVATVQGGSITLQAARDLVAQGAQVASVGDLSAVAGRGLNVGAATTTYQFATSSHAGDTLAIQQSGSTQHGSTLSAGGNATLVAQGGDLTVQASQVAAGHDAVLSGHDVSIAAGVNSASDATQLQWSAGHATLADSSQSAAGAGVSAGNNLTVQAVGNGQAGSGDLTVTGATLSAQNGQATLQAAHDLNVGTLALSQSSSAHVHSESHGLLSSGSVTSDTSSASTTQQGSTVSGNTVAMDAGHDLGVSGSNVAGTGSAAGAGQVSLTAGNTLNVLAAANMQSAHSATHSSGGLFGSDKGQSTAEQSQTTAQASSLTGSNIQLQSGSDMTLQAAQIKGQSLSAQAGTLNGQVVDPNAQLHIDAAINDSSSSRSSSGHGLLTQSSSGQGQVRQTLQYTTIDVPGADKANGPVQLQATGGITVGASSLSPAGGAGSASASSTTSGSGVPTITVDLKQQAQQLASQPGLSYLGPLSQRNDVAWQEVQLASQSWNYHQSGLTGVGAAIVAVAVACATGGMGAGLAGATAGTSTAAMANAAFTTLVTQASTALIDNGGNLGAALRTLGSSASVKSLVASIATAGLENVQLAGGQSLNGMSGLSNLGQTDTSLASSSAVTPSTMEGIAGRAVASAGVDSLLQGTSFGQGLIDSTVSDASALGAFAIGDAHVSGAFGSGVGGELGYVGSHALLGCAAGAATGAGCGGQAIGAAVSAATANGIADLVTGGQGVSNSGQLAAITTATTLLGAGVAAALGQNPNAAVTGASNETLNNTCADGHNCGETPAGKVLPEIVPGQEANPADPVSEEKALAQEGEVAAFGAAGAASAGVTTNSGGNLTAAQQLVANRAAGNAFEQAVGSDLGQSGLTVGQQITIETESGVRTRLDFLTLDPITGDVGCVECKASSTAPLTKNQTLAFPEIGQSGGTIVGAGKPGFPGGTKIPPTNVQVIRGP